MTDRPTTEPPAHLHAYTCAYCTGDGIDRPDFVDREDFEAHMAHLHHGLPFEFPRAEAAQGAAPRAEGHHNRDGCNPYDEAHIAGKAGAAPRAEGLDVERLRRVLWETDIYWRFANDEVGHGDLNRFADDIAVEYARLGAGATGEPKPHFHEEQATSGSWVRVACREDHEGERHE